MDVAGGIQWISDTRISTVRDQPSGASRSADRGISRRQILPNTTWTLKNSKHVLHCAHGPNPIFPTFSEIAHMVKESMRSGLGLGENR